MRASLSNPISRSKPDQLSARLKLLSGHIPTFRQPKMDFIGEVEMGRIGGISIARLTHNALFMQRGIPPRNGAYSHKLLLVAQLSSKSVISQDGTTITLSPGDLTLIDADRAFSATFEGLNSQILTYLPAEEVLAGLPHSERSTRLKLHVVGDSLGILAGQLLSVLIKELEYLGDEDGACARRMLIELGRGLLAKQSKPAGLDNVAIPSGKIRNFIEANLAHPALTPAMIAEGCQISVRRLHRAFAATRWTACEWIRHQRLERCRADLLDANLLQQSVTEIAFRWGFNDSAHFSRVFRQEYGVTPSEVRRRAGSRHLDS